jgi:thiol-disulfide isomerase/thioredoxin
MVTYRYSKDMSEQEWDDIREQALRRARSDADTRRAQDERIGHEPPPFPAESQWLNSSPFTWRDLRGKAVLLQFWSRNCGPCKSFMHLLKASKDRGDIVVIGVHAANSDTNAIKEILASFKADGPVCVDVPPESPGHGFGFLSSWFRISAIPAWIVVGPDGKVAAHSLRPNEAFQLAGKTLSNRAQ